MPFTEIKTEKKFSCSAFLPLYIHSLLLREPVARFEFFLARNTL